MRASLERSLRQLGTDYVDIFFVHDPPLDGSGLSDELCDALLAERSAGNARLIGIAGAAGIAHSRGIHADVFDVIQVPEAAWDGSGREPDVTFGVVSAVPKSHPDGGESRAQVAVARALARRPRGVVLVGTRRIAHLEEIAMVALGPKVR
jgi:aryl-alcohol dehydrogenase-like predicted oxidoreductase